ncbi:MAG: Clp protease ClpP [Synergistaceae bacterium]|nr:Clp protease ClpP [Synergistaceae bacterium]
MYKITNQSGDSTEILLYSLIEGGTTAAKVIKSLQSNPSGNITLRINSDGGEVFDAIALYNYLKDKHVTVIIDGMCASAASIVAMCGEKIIMKSGSMMMIHNPVTLAFGDSSDMKNAAEMLDKVTGIIEDIYQAKTGLQGEEIVEMMNAQTWMTPQEALEHGFCDEIETDPTLPDLAEPFTETLNYSDGVTAERERLRALDELYTPSRASILNRAKYETGETAEQIALELLKTERVRETVDVNNFAGADKTSGIIADMAEYINRRRG